jgi:hypothetical protein
MNDDHDKMVVMGRKGLEKRVRSCLQVPVHQDRALVVHDADRHGARMQISAAVKWVLIGVKSPEISSSFVNDFLPRSADPEGMLRGRLQSLSTPCRCDPFPGNDLPDR